MKKEGLLTGQTLLAASLPFILAGCIEVNPVLFGAIAIGVMGALFWISKKEDQKTSYED